MKEIIVIKKHELYTLLDCLPMTMITDEDLEKEIKEGRKIVLFGKERKAEKVPESWEELKELCKGLNRIRIANIEGTESIVLDNTLIFNKYGNVFAEFPEYTYCFARNRTIPQIWVFIKSLIGEE